MWPLYPLSKNIVGIAITPDYLMCSFITEHAQTFTMQAFYKKLLHNYEVIGTTLFNNSALAQSITHFLRQHGLQNAYIALSYLDTIGSNRPEHTLQYQLLALQIPLNCIIITPHTTALTKCKSTAHPQLHYNDTSMSEYDRTQCMGLYLLGKELV